MSTSATATTPPLPGPAARRRVIDAPTRLFHALFALSFLGAYLSADSDDWRALHVTLGYTMAGLFAARLLYGLFGPRQARLGLWWRRLGGAPAWLRALPRRPGASGLNWRQGQNLLTALAVVALLVLVLPLTLSGYATLHEWGGEAFEEVHEFLANAFLALVLVHLALIAGASVLRGSNQARPMLTGTTEGPGPDLVPRNRAGLAAMLLVAVLVFWAWAWHTSADGLVPDRPWIGNASERARHDDDD